MFEPLTADSDLLPGGATSESVLASSVYGHNVPIVPKSSLKWSQTPDSGFLQLKNGWTWHEKQLARFFFTFSAMHQDGTPEPHFQFNLTVFV